MRVGLEYKLKKELKTQFPKVLSEKREENVKKTKKRN